MYDIDPPARVLRLDAPRKASQPTALSDRQHLAQLAQADSIAVRHSVGAAILRLNTLARADGSLARQFDAL